MSTVDVQRRSLNDGYFGDVGEERADRWPRDRSLVMQDAVGG
jgi:hypothetical protein